MCLANLRAGYAGGTYLQLECLVSKATVTARTCRALSGIRHGTAVVTDTPSPSVSHRPMVSGISIRYIHLVRPLMRAMGVLSIESLPALEFRQFKPYRGHSLTKVRIQ